MPDFITAFAPARVAKLNCGFDCMGLALSYPGDRCSARRITKNEVLIEAISYGVHLSEKDQVPEDPEKNTASIAARAFLDEYTPGFGVSLSLHKELPSGSGLGSSAASAVAAVMAVNGLLEEPLPKPALLEAALHAEAQISGDRHADNIAPCLFGGIGLVRELDPIDYIPLPIPEGLSLAILSPRVTIETKAARTSLPASVSLTQAVKQSAHSAALVAALYSGNEGLLGRSMQDFLVYDARHTQIPDCTAILTAARGAGALASGISGSGPALFALVKEQRSHEVLQAMKDACSHDADGMLCGIHTKGAILL